MRRVLDNLKHYIQDTLAVSITIEKWSEGKHLPFFLQDSYVFYRVQLLELNCLMMLDTRDQEESPAVIRKHMDALKLLGHRIVAEKESLEKRGISDGIDEKVAEKTDILPRDKIIEMLTNADRVIPWQ